MVFLFIVESSVTETVVPVTLVLILLGICTVILLIYIRYMHVSLCICFHDNDLGIFAYLKNEICIANIKIVKK